MEAQGANGDDLGKKKALLARVQELHEFNPMLGLRGCRLGLTLPEIAIMQARAIFEAACAVTKSGKKVVPELIQGEATADNITGEVAHLLKDNHHYQKVCEDLASIKKELGKPGASKRAAQIAVSMLTH